MNLLLSIELDDFIHKVKAYQNSEYGLEDLYQKILKRHDIWDNLQDINESKTEEILKFLNQWKCRLSYKFTFILKNTLREVSRSLSEFNEHRLDDISWESLLKDSNAIEKIFSKIATNKINDRRFGATATSKILHLTNPNFFMMYDNKIRYNYGCSDNELGYVNFMWRMKLFADYLIREYSIIRKTSKESVFENLVSECNSKATTLPKLLDEYNWTKYNA